MRFLLVAFALLLPCVAAAQSRSAPSAGNGPPIYTGAIATRSYVPTDNTSSNNSLNSRTTHFARTDIKSVQIVIPNFYTKGGIPETGIGGPATVTACLEYPAGTYIPFKFSGSTTGTIPNGGILTSDSLSISIPFGAEFFTRIHILNSAGIVWTQFSAASAFMSTDAMNFGNNVTDESCSGTISDTFTQIKFFPLAIVGPTTRPSACLYGDSRQSGYGDTADAWGDTGEFARSIGPAYAYINLGTYGDTVSTFLGTGSATNRLAMAQYCTQVFEEYGINDLSIGKTAAELEGYTNQFIALFPGKEVWVATLPPETTSTDGWATTTNQTAASNNTDRINFNTAVRGGNSIVGARGYVEESGVVESGFNSGLWCAPSCTADGVHENIQSAVHEQAASVVPVWGMTR